MFELKVF